MADISKEKEIFKKFFPKNLIAFFRKMVYPEKIYLIENDLSSLFKTYYQQLAAPGFSQKIAMKNAEFKVFSKNGGDGILLYIFSKIGVASRTFVEMGIEDGRECNTANLSLNFGWRGMIIDAWDEGIKKARFFYKENLGNIFSEKVKITHCFVTAENINQLLSDNNIRGEVDLLSIDIDSNDYWVWKAINIINPRVVAVEYNSAFGLRPITVKYNPDRGYKREKPLYFGASLSALVKLAHEKGYILACCDTQGHDAFFIRKDIASGIFIDLPAEAAFYHNPYTVRAVGDAEKQFDQVKHLDFDYV